MADAPIYFYQSEIERGGEKNLRLVAEFKGRDGNGSPERLFVASLDNCYILTLLAIAEFSKIQLLSVASSVIPE